MSKSTQVKLPLSFDAVVLYELITDVFEIIIGLSLLILGDELLEFYVNIRNTGVLDSAHNLPVLLFQKGMPYITDHYLFIGLYLSMVGILKIICGIGLAHRKRWADYLLVAMLLLFLPLDVIGLVNHPSLTKVLFIAVNIAIIVYLTRDKIIKRLLKK